MLMKTCFDWRKRTRESEQTKEFNGFTRTRTKRKVVLKRSARDLNSSQLTGAVEQVERVMLSHLIIYRHLSKYITTLKTILLRRRLGYPLVRSLILH